MSDFLPPPPPPSPDNGALPPEQPGTPAAEAPTPRRRTPLLIAVIVIAIVAVGAAIVVTRSGDDSGDNGGLASACADVDTAFGPEGIAKLSSAMNDLSGLESMSAEDFNTTTLENAADSIDVLADTIEPFATLLAELDNSKEFNEADPDSGVREMRATMEDAVAGLRKAADIFRNMKTIDDLASSTEQLMVLSDEMNAVGESLNSFSSSPSADAYLMGIPQCASMIDTLNSL